ncbi:MAG: sugar phosphate isomerase/epimerase family protein [Bacteroidota bacterium]
MQRRTFLQTSSLGLAGIGLGNTPLGATATTQNADRAFKISLKADAIGVSGPIVNLLEPVVAMGYESLAMPSEELIAMSGSQLQDLKLRADGIGLSWGSAGLPIQFREDEARFQADLEALPQHARAMQTIGIERVGTWIMPCNEERDFSVNFALHASRLRQVAAVLVDYNIRLGLEYVAPRTLRNAKRYAFIDNGKQLKELIKAIGQPNVGVVLDSFHWYCAEESVNDLHIWDNSSIVAVDLNDADRNLGPREQIDGNRELPGATGQIDIAAFVGFLDQISYDGPVRAEPFNSTLNAMRDELAMQATIEAIKSVIG